MNIFKRFFNWITKYKTSTEATHQDNLVTTGKFPDVDAISVIYTKYPERESDPEIDKIADSIQPLSSGFRRSIENLLSPGRELIGSAFYNSKFANSYKFVINKSSNDLHFELSSSFEKSPLVIEKTNQTFELAQDNLNYSRSSYPEPSIPDNNWFDMSIDRICGYISKDTTSKDQNEVANEIAPTQCKDVKIIDKKILQLKLKNNKKSKKKKK